MKRRELMTLLVGVVGIPTATLAKDDDNFADWLADWNRFAQAGNRYAQALNEGRIDDAAKALPRMKALGKKLFCVEESTVLESGGGITIVPIPGREVECATFDSKTGKIESVPCPKGWQD